MLTVDQALQLVLERAAPLAVTSVARDDALGLLLAEEVTSDVDSPPHDKSIVDGYAVVAADLASGTAELEILEEVVAGDVPSRRVVPGCAARIMTGAPIPEGADAVVMIERTEIVPREGAALGMVRIRPATAERSGAMKPGQNISPRGISMRRGDVVLRPGVRLRPIEIGLLAEVGRQMVRVVPRPTVAILSTGNELLPADRIPAAGQIRNSNGPMLAACAATAGATVLNLGIGRDDRDELRRLIGQGLMADVLVLSGGVSAGVLDLVPGVLAELGVQQVFHKVQLKPGKPLWFGTLPSGDGQVNKLVFGLPGNPVSSLVGFELFVRPAIRRLMRDTDPRPKPISATLAVEFVQRGDRPTYHPALLETTDGQPRAMPLRWQGSADLRALAAANALIHFPAGDHRFDVGEIVQAIPI